MKFINFDVTSDFPELIEADHVTRPSDPIFGPKISSPGFFYFLWNWFYIGGTDSNPGNEY